MLNLYTYRLSFKHPFFTSVGAFEFRDGLILRYQSSDADVVTEVAPLPGFSNETLSKTKSHLLSIKEQAALFLNRRFTPDELSDWIKKLSVYPSVDFGLSSLGLSILSARQQLPVHSILGLTSAASLKVNAVLGITNKASFLTQARTLITKGFRVLKCKVTVQPGHLPHSLKTLAYEYPHITFRLDANRSWPVNRVTELSSRFQDLPVEYIEEPCRVISVDQFDSVSKHCILPLAADESLSDLGLRSFINQTKCKPYLIIKPMFHGNLMELFATIGSQNNLEDRVIFTTALESAVGTRMIASIAAMTGTKTTAHGLNTGSLFRQNLVDKDDVKNGTFQLQPNFKGRYSFKDINQTLITPVR